MPLPCTCAPIRWEVFVGLSCLSTPFLWCLPKETVSSRQRKALFCPGGSTIRVSAAASVDGTFLARLGEGVGGLPGAQVSLTQSAVMLGLRVRGRGGWDRTCPVAAPISAFLWGSTPFLCARAKKWGGTGRASAVYCPRKRRTRTKRKTRRPCHCAFCVCADTLGGSRWPVLRFDPISLVLAQRNGVEPPKKSAFLPRQLHHPRERCQSVVYTFLARLGEGVGGWRGIGAGRSLCGILKPESYGLVTRM